MRALGLLSVGVALVALFATVAGTGREERRRLAPKTPVFERPDTAQESPLNDRPWRDDFCTSVPPARTPGAGEDRAASCDHCESDNDLPFEESLGKKDFVSDAPFAGPATGAAIGLSGGGPNTIAFLLPRNPPKKESAEEMAFSWLARNQAKDGSFQQDPALTGLAITAFISLGHTHKHGYHKKVVKAALKYLKKSQDEDGCIGPRRVPREAFGHALATLALCEAYAMTGSPLFKAPALSALKHGLRQGLPDTPVALWLLLAVRTAEVAKLPLPENAGKAAREWLKRRAAPGSMDCAPGLFVPEGRAAQLAAGFFLRTVFEERLETKYLFGPPSGGPLDAAYWYFGAASAHLNPKGNWNSWSDALRDVAIPAQRTQGKDKGSWDPVGISGDRLGRVGTTALMLKGLGIRRLYPRVFRSKSQRTK